MEGTTNLFIREGFTTMAEHFGMEWRQYTVLRQYTLQGCVHLMGSRLLGVGWRGGGQVAGGHGGGVKVSPIREEF